MVMSIIKGQINGPYGGGGAATSADANGRNRRRSPNQEQSVIVYDLISEGPIQGLIDGASSIYLDTTQVLNNSYKTSHNPKQSFDVSYNASTNTITDNTGSSMFSGYNSSNGTYKIRVEEAKKTISGISITAGSKTVTSSGGFATNDVSKAYVSGQYLRIKEGGPNKTTLVCKITKYTSATSVEIDRMAEITASSLAGTIDLCGTVSSTTNSNTAVITPDTGGDRTVANTAVFMDSPSSVAEYQATNFNYNYDNVTYGFKTGERSQSYVGTAADTGNASVIANISKTLTTTDLSGIGVSNSYSNYGYGIKGDETSTWTANPIIVTSTQMNLSTQKSAVDRLKITFQYDSMYSLKSKNGTEGPASIEHRIYLRYKNPGDTSFTEDLIYGPTDSTLLARQANKRVRGWDYSSSGTVEAYCKNPFVEVFDINLEPYQPLEDYEIKVETITPISRNNGGWMHQNSGRLQSIESVINDKLSYPLAAYGQMMFNASDFGNVPERGYHARGLKIMVPTNYSPNHEGYEGSPAQYTRNITTGAVGSNYVAWDGNFRGDTDVFDATSPNFEKVYSNNPAWVFYDLISNNRYGCGEYINASDIDKYALFKIARYCDELVPDGEGGTEPRFTANVWFTEQAQAMKVMQDMLSIFRGMMTWQNGQIVIEQNREKSPIAAFNKGNVINGDFSYQSTRNRFRYNQVNVTWNDPRAMYKKTVEIVEDHDNILETRQIKKKDVVAFGCTSRAQAVRYGKWHLFTDQMETDVVSFATGLEGQSLKSGDVVTIADADRNNLRFGGRTLDNSTTTNIKVDSSLDLSNTATFFMEVVFPEGGAYLQQNTATIRGASRKRGDFIQYADNVAGSNTALTSETIMVNAVDDSGNKLDLVWSGETRVERQEVSSYNSTSVTVASAFTSAPVTHSIWAIIELDADGQYVHGSAKEYIIQNIKEDDDDPIFTVSAVEYNREKFSLVDRGYVIEDVPETARMPRYTENVPFPTDVVLKAVPHQRESFDTTTESAESSLLDLAITWGHPSTDRTDIDGNAITNKYEFIESYEVKHNLGFSGKFKTEIVPSTETSFLIENPAQKIGTVLVRLTNTQGHFSKWIRREIDTSLMVLKIPTSTTSKIGAIATGGGLSTGLSINSSTGLVSLGSTTYDFSNTLGDRLGVESGNAAQTSQAFSGVSDGGEAFLVYDFSDTSDPLKAIEIKVDTTARNPNVGDNNEILFYNFEYVSEVGAANAGLTQKTGTVSIPQYSSEVTGSGTSFTTEYEVGDRIIIGTTTTRYFATVTSIQSDTKLFLDQSVPRSYSSINIFKTSFISDNQDTVIGKVTRSGSTYTLVSFLSGGTGEDGDPGEDGDNLATVQLWRRTTTNSAPAVIDNNTTFTFATGVLSGSLDSWSQTVPTGTAKYLWTCSAQALGVNGAATDVIATGDWSTPVLQSEAQEPRFATKPIYYDNWTLASAFPSSPSTASLSYNFTTKALTGLPTGWSTTPATIPYVFSSVQITEATFGGTQSFVVRDLIPVGGKFDRFDPTDFDLNIDDSTHKFQFKFLGSDGFANAGSSGIPDKYKNDSMSIDFDGVNPRLTKYTGQTVTGTTPAGLLNSGITLNQSGGTFTLGRGGFSNDTASIAKGDVGLGNLSNNAQVRQDLVGAPGGVLNSGITLNQSGGTFTLGRGGFADDTASIAKADVGLGNLSNNAQVRQDLVGAPGGVLNSGITISQSGGTFTLGRGGFSDDTASIAKADVGLGNLSNNAQVRQDLVGAPGGVLNSGITISQSGGTFTLGRGGFANDTASIAKADVGLGNLSNNAQVRQDLVGAPTTIKNSSIGINDDGTLSNAGSGQVTKAGVGLGNLSNNAQIRQDLVGAPGGVLNSGITISQSGGTFTLGRGGFSNDTASIAKADVGLGNLSNNAQVRQDLVGAPGGVLNSSVTINANGTLSNAGSGQVTKAGVGLGNLSNNAQLRQDLVGAPGGVLNSSVSLSASGVLSGGGSSSQINVGSIANSPFDTSGNVDTGETITVGSKFTIDRNNERILIED